MAALVLVGGRHNVINVIIPEAMVITRALEDREFSGVFQSPFLISYFFPLNLGKQYW